MRCLLWTPLALNTWGCPATVDKGCCNRARKLPSAELSLFFLWQITALDLYKQIASAWCLALTWCLREKRFEVIVEQVADGANIVKPFCSRKKLFFQWLPTLVVGKLGRLALIFGPSNIFLLWAAWYVTAVLRRLLQQWFLTWGWIYSRRSMVNNGQWFIVSYHSANKQKHHKSHRMQ